jgi:hypothetical protein
MSAAGKRRRFNGADSLAVSAKTTVNPLVSAHATVAPSSPRSSRSPGTGHVHTTLNPVVAAQVTHVPSSPRASRSPGPGQVHTTLNPLVAAHITHVPAGGPYVPTRPKRARTQGQGGQGGAGVSAASVEASSEPLSAGADEASAEAGAPPSVPDSALLGLGFQVVKTFADLKAAVLFAEGAVAEYAALQSAARDALIVRHASLVERAHIVRYSAKALRCFTDVIPIVVDIDDTVVFSDDDFSDEHAVPNYPVIKFLQRLKADPTFGHRVRIHYVTARLHDPDMSNHAWTERQLAACSVPPHASLHLAPDAVRVSRTAIAEWKWRMRRAIALEAAAPVVLSIGDQLSDLMRVHDDADFDRFDAHTNAPESPFAVIRASDGCTLWGLKLRAR